MTDKPDTPVAGEQTAPRKPDGVLTKRIDGKTFIIEIFFDHDSKETFQDKIVKVIRAEQAE